MVRNLSDFLFLCFFGAGLGEDAMIGAFVFLGMTQWIGYWMYCEIDCANKFDVVSKYTLDLDCVGSNSFSAQVIKLISHYIKWL